MVVYVVYVVVKKQSLCFRFFYVRDVRHVRAIFRFVYTYVRDEFVTGDN